jgi:hypothetical protein
VCRRPASHAANPIPNSALVVAMTYAGKKRSTVCATFFTIHYIILYPDYNHIKKELVQDNSLFILLLRRQRQLAGCRMIKGR